MKIKQILSPAVVSTSLKSSTKEEIIRELLDLLVSAGYVSDKDEVFAALMERERKMSTGIQIGRAHV